MGKIDELIKQLCPDGVKFVKLGDFFDMFKGMSKVSKKWADTGNCKFIDYLNIYNNMTVDVAKLQNATVATFKQNNLKEGDILFTCASETPYECAISAVIREPIAENTFLDDHLNGIRVKREFKEMVLPAFINYYFYSVAFRKSICKIVRGVTRFYIVNKSFLNIMIPLPPLAVQEKIVEVLDTFTGMIDNLQKELEQRQKQFEYYREILFAKRHSELKWEYIKNIALNCYAGATPSTKNKEYWEGGNIPWMSSGEVHQGQVLRVEGRITQKGYDHCSTKMVPRDSVVIALAGQGKTRGTVAITRIELCTNQSICAIVPDKTKVLPDYLYYYLKGQYFDLRRLSSGDGTRGGLNLKMINNYGIPIVSLGHQREIVEILDTFEALISNIKQEIELRQKQYEYYREKLLTFE